MPTGTKGGEVKNILRIARKSLRRKGWILQGSADHWLFYQWFTVFISLALDWSMWRDEVYGESNKRVVIWRDEVYGKSSKKVLLCYNTRRSFRQRKGLRKIYLYLQSYLYLYLRTICMSKATSVGRVESLQNIFYPVTRLMEAWSLVTGSLLNQLLQLGL